MFGNILITSAGRRVSLVRAFQSEIKKLSLGAEVYCCDIKPELSSACNIADKYFRVKKVSDDGAIEELLCLCVENDIKIIIPTIDTELLIFAKMRDKFAQKRIKILISDEKIIQYCQDKRKTHDFFDSLSIKRAQEYKLDNITYPFFVKPYDGSRSQGTYLIEKKEQLDESIVNNKKNMFLQYYSKEYYDEYTVDLYFNKCSEIIAIIPRERIFVRDGEVNKACTRKNNIIDYLKLRMNKVLGFRGCITIQLFKRKDKNEYCAIEINPRFGGGYPLSYLAGGNFPKWIIEEYLLNVEVNDYVENWKDNLLMLRYDAEVLIDDYEG